MTEWPEPLVLLIVIHLLARSEGCFIFRFDCLSLETV